MTGSGRRVLNWSTSMVGFAVCSVLSAVLVLSFHVADSPGAEPTPASVCSGSVTPVEFPFSVHTKVVDWFPGLSVGSGFSLTSASPGQMVAEIDTANMTRRGGQIGSRLHASVSTERLEREGGSQLDLSIEGRYLSVYGRASVVDSRYSSSQSSAFSFSFLEDQQRGRFSPSFPKEQFLALRALYCQDPHQFETIYGDHYVSAVDVHSYLRVTFFVQNMSAAAASSANLGLDVGAGWGPVGFSLSTQYQSALKQLSKVTSVQLDVETSAVDAQMPLDALRRESDVDSVVASMKVIEAALSSSEPVAYRFYLTPWADIFGAPAPPQSEDPSYAGITHDYYELQNLGHAVRDLGSIDNSYLGETIQKYYAAKYEEIQSQQQDLLDILRNTSRMKEYNAPKVQVELVMPPHVELRRDPPQDQHHRLALYADVTGAVGEYRTYLVNREGVRVDPSGAAVNDGCQTPSTCVRTISFVHEYAPGVSPLWNQPDNCVDGTVGGWMFRAETISGQVIASAPVPKFLP